MTYFLRHLTSTSYFADVKGSSFFTDSTLIKFHGHSFDTVGVTKGETPPAQEEKIDNFNRAKKEPKATQNK